MLEMKLQKLIALAMDMDRAIVITEKVKNSSTFKTWKTRVEEIQTEVRALLNEYESISQSKKKKKVSLSQKMEEKCMEVSGLVEEGTVMIAHF
ncbi:conserved hypothetical protein [Ricinus communis]|uniref:Rx N-terminal domain-containing protein n=2 Tax=Ricinus communis TaxID=3988 RepID=B9SS88_RICCO|nr:conserved hypothetical protein [Ricinus communis]